ncbi:hypothetical protein [Micromonospora sp. NPDC050495]|uniref:hypothetical protein n=1 Tax=Micromonospora sp. NPDC050495 TaxID=3154936 RepID=UPI0033C8E955
MILAVPGPSSRLYGPVAELVGSRFTGLSEAHPRSLWHRLGPDIVVDPVLTPEATARELTHRYRETVAEFARPRIAGQIAQEVVWDVLGATVPSTVVFKYGLRALTWRKAAQRAKPFLLLMHLERAVRRQPPHLG